MVLVASMLSSSYLGLLVIIFEDNLLIKRIVNYLKVGQHVKQSTEMGFIKFGSRVDVLLPIGTKVEVTLNQVVQGGVTVLATL